MWHLYQFPLCPFSRKVQLALGEKKIGYELVTLYPWDADERFRQLNPAGRVPVLHDPDKRITLMDSMAICEYLEETIDDRPLILGTARARAEVRRLVALFDESFYSDITAPLMYEKMRKRLVLRQSPDSRTLTAARRLLHEHLDYIDWLIDNRRWLAGSQLSLADFAAVAHLSVVDYLGDMDWTGHDSAHGWYRVMKSRPSFAPLLRQKMEGLPPPRNYADVNA
ncbi:glutathione S-transferase family protein [Erythrobacter arachoides]|uniref:Glutathione S-transferase family protein n=1 Tax=Aurantiacibacter arachoides TaxID=1850444 RepID=A0A845A5W6_9SPHN|nr:glutathione S-transferase family protein [Aurantiacibacter arachoides]MXO94327.1 glutathione S-transferase family protein [Aurantiacibacter arachoides]GGD64341.1 glutathione S-transferase [Aurantiacibacter arachoides]